MAFLGRLKVELDRAGRAAQQALDEGRLRLELHRARQRADRAAQALGYAAYRARRTTDAELAPEQWARLAGDIARAEEEVQRLQAELDALGGERRTAGPQAAPSSEPQQPV